METRRRLAANSLVIRQLQARMCFLNGDKLNCGLCRIKDSQLNAEGCGFRSLGEGCAVFALTKMTEMSACRESMPPTGTPILSHKYS